MPAVTDDAGSIPAVPAVVWRNSDMKLYELPPAFAEVELAAADGELDAASMERLAALEGELSARVDGCCRVVRGLEARAGAFVAEAERLRSRAAVAVANARRLKEYVRQNLEAMGVPRVETALFTVRLQQNPAAVNLAPGLEPEALPEEFRRTRCEPDRAALLLAHKQGRPLPNGVTITRTTGLRIT